MTSVKISEKPGKLKPEKFKNRHLMLKILEKQINCPGFATLFFEYNLDFRPGQFIMVWIPGIDEKPYTISHHSKKKFGITIEAKGIFSKKAIGLEKGDLVGIRGPFGTGFDIVPSSFSVAVIAGGCGIAPLATLVEKLDDSTFFIHGARSKEFLLYPGRFKTGRHYCTDDGSKGHKGFVTDLLEKEIQSRKIKNSGKNAEITGNTGNAENTGNAGNAENTGLTVQEGKAGRDQQAEKTVNTGAFDMVYACGPEIMMYRVFQICESNGIPCQVSLERYMRCGFGVCGACVCGDRLVCRDGPVFGSDKLRSMADFNRTALLKSGKAVDMNQFVSWRSR